MACLTFVTDDNSLDDAELWEFVDSTIARRSSYKPLVMPEAPVVTELPASPRIVTDQSKFCKGQKRHASSKPDIANSFVDYKPSPLRICPPSYSASEDAWIQPRKLSRRDQELAVSERRYESHGTVQRSYVSMRDPPNQIVPHESSRDLVMGAHVGNAQSEIKENCFTSMKRSPGNDWMQNIPSASMFKHIQAAALSILEKGDYVMMQGKPFIKKSGWRKIAFFFNVSFEIKDRSIQIDQSNNVQRAEFVVRANMQSGRYSDGWGSCDRGEKKFSKPNHDIPSTAETRAKTRACQDLLGIGEYKAGCEKR